MVSFETKKKLKFFFFVESLPLSGIFIVDIFCVGVCVYKRGSIIFL